MLVFYFSTTMHIVMSYNGNAHDFNSTITVLKL